MRPSAPASCACKGGVARQPLVSGFRRARRGQHARARVTADSTRAAQGAFRGGQVVTGSRGRAQMRTAPRCPRARLAPAPVPPPGFPYALGHALGRENAGRRKRAAVSPRLALRRQPPGTETDSPGRDARVRAPLSPARKAPQRTTRCTPLSRDLPKSALSSKRVRENT